MTGSYRGSGSVNHSAALSFRCGLTLGGQTAAGDRRARVTMKRAAAQAGPFQVPSCAVTCM
jgi:hypothetical protein